jgi:putative heme-binding domain-containing protein
MKPLVALMLAIAMLAVSPALSGVQSDAGAMVRLLKSGRLPPERVASVVNLVCQRGNEDDLAYVYGEAVKPDAFTGDIRRQALEGLAAAAQTRKVHPKVDAGALAALVDDRDPTTARAAVRLAAAWKAPALAAPLASRVLDARTSDESRRLALGALLAIGGEPTRETADKLLASENLRLRAYGVAALASLDLEAAAQRAAALLADPVMSAHFDVLFGAFLDRQGGSEQLAAAIAAISIPADTGKIALRHIYLAGRSDQALVDVLSKSAGLDVEKAPPTPEELKRLSAEALAKGDPVRGEAIFRRADLGCLKCHAISGAGGDVGPDLSPVGATSPVDYVITSILQPDLSIKESFLTRNFITSGGMIHQGIVVDRDDNRVIVKDATGQKITIPTADIDEESEGRSLMPKGLASFLTHVEFLDLARFIGELGKPGPYAVRSQPTIQRWRYLKETPAELADQVPDAQAFARHVLGADPSQWLPAYGCVAGGLPLGELTTDGRKVLYLRGEIDITAPGEVEIGFNTARGITAWVDDRQLAADVPRTVTLDRGLHKITLRIDTGKRDSRELRVVVEKPPGSTVVYTVVGGP